MKKIKKSTIFKIILLVLGCFFLIKNIGKTIIFPYPFNMQFDNIHSASFIDEKTALIIDKQATRITILENGQVTSIRELNKNDTFDRVYNVLNDGKYFYVLGIKYREDGIVVEKDLIARYDKDGSNEKIIYELKNEKNDDTLPNLEEFTHIKNNFYVTKQIPLYDITNSYYAEIIKLNISNGELIDTKIVANSKIDFLYTASFCEFNDNIFSTDYMGNAFVNDVKIDGLAGRSIKDIVCDDKGNYYCLDENNLVLIDNHNNIILKDVVSNDLSYENNKLHFDNVNDKKYYIYDVNTKQIKKIESAPYNIYLYFDALFTYLVIFIIIVLIVKALITSLINAYKNNNELYIERFFVIVGGFCIITFLTVFFANQLVENNIKKINEDTQIEAEYFSEIFDEEVTYNDFQEFFKNYIRVLRKHENIEAINVYLYDKKYGDLDLVYSTNNYLQSGANMQKEFIVNC